MVTENRGSAGEPLDFQRFLTEMCDGNRGLALKLVRLLIEERAPELLAQISAAVAAGDERQIRNHCHTIQGTVANMCADSICRLAAELSTCAREGRTEEFDRLLTELTEEFSGLQEWGRAFISAEEDS